MITFNLQSFCIPCKHPNSTLQVCQDVSSGCLPSLELVRAWELPELSTDVWVAAAASFTAQYIVLVADHMSGFALWPTQQHNASIAATSWRGGKGDVLKDFRASCARAQVSPGLFYSTHFNWVLGVNEYKVGWPRLYGGPQLTQAQYEDVVLAQLGELAAYPAADGLGPWFELWFDGGVNTAVTPRVGPAVRSLFPTSLCHSCLGFSEDASAPLGSGGRGIRWMGNEEGANPLPSWGPLYNGTLGSPQAPIFVPPSCDTVLEEHYWFFKPGDAAALRSTCALLNVYLTSVGRDSNLILNMAPNSQGGLQAEEVKAYSDLGKGISCLWSSPLATWENATLDHQSGAADFPLPSPIPCPAGGCLHTLTLQEDLGEGQRMAQWGVQALVGGSWVDVTPMGKDAATGVGHKRIVALRIPAGELGALRVSLLSGYLWQGRVAPFTLLQVGLWERGTLGCLPAGCQLVDY